VGNRLGEVFETFGRLKEFSPEARWLDTKSNPADLISRGCDGPDFKEQFQFWTSGPDFLGKSEDEWPIPPPLPEKEPELRKYIVSATVQQHDQFQNFKNLAEYIRYKLEVVEPTLEQLQATEEGLVKQIQEECFANEIKELQESAQRGRSKTFRKGPLQRKEVFLDKRGMLRLVTRFGAAECFSWEERNPILLTSRHLATALLVREYHHRVSHSGSRNTFAALCKKYHIPWNVVKNEVFRCQDCRERHPLPAQAPLGQLHPFRLQAWQHVFKKTGMDFFGPFVIKRGQKVWGLLFTCLTTRAVHIEPCPSLNVPTWLNAINRFVSRRGKPETIACDQAGTFVGGSKQLAKIVEDQLSAQFQQELVQKVAEKFQIEFAFIPKRMPHHGGAWERMVREAQRAMVRSASTVSGLSYDALVTFLVHAEGTINRRPLAIDEDLGVITPMSILAPASEAAYGFPTLTSLSRVLGQLRQCIDHFWRMWMQLYLRGLSVDRFPRGSPGYVELRPGDRVFFRRGEKFHRLQDKPALEAGKIIRAYHSEDGIARRFQIEDRDGKFLDIPLHRIFIPDQARVEQRGSASGLVPLSE
jgi:hypothetical protein